jgi:predicted P-loop ATPase
MHNELKELLIVFKQLSSDVERKEWFDNNKSTIIPLLADLSEHDKDHYDVVIEEIVDLMPHGTKKKIRQDIKFHVNATIAKRIKERNAHHFTEEVELERDAQGNIRATIINISTILLKNKNILIRFDEFTNRSYYEVYGEYKLPWHGSNTAITIDYKVEHAEKATKTIRYYNAMGQYELAALKHYMQQFFPGEIAWRILEEAIIYSAQQNKINIYQDYFRFGLPEWDGLDRMDVFHRYAGVKHKRWAMIIAKQLFVAMMARCFMPGYDYRGIITFEGAQDIGKSRMCKAFTFHEAFFTQFTFDKNNHGYEVSRQIEGMAVIEFPDMGGINSRDTNYVKAFFTAVHDRNRRMNQNLVEHIKRCGIFIITTNYSEPYLNDQTGNSRYLPCNCETNHIDVEAIESEMPQLLAQAYYMWKSGVTPRLTDEEKQLQQIFLNPREVKSDYYFWLIPVLKLHRNDFIRSEINWNDGATLEEILDWCQGEDWWPSMHRYKHKSKIAAALEKHFHIDNVVRTKSVDGKQQSFRKYRYIGDKDWNEFIDSLEE